MLTATLLLTAQGCGVVSETTHPSISSSAVLPPEIRSEPPTEQPKTDTPSFENPSAAIIPRSQETDEAPPTDTLPTPPPPKIVETGMASWYGAKHQGKRTASGEVFNQDKFTAAHRSFPWGSVVKVTNLANGKSVEVRINDRGPFGKGRIIDVSRAAARVLGMVESGVTLVRVELLSPLETPDDLVLQNR
jgi:peptidoglycan lytic transglycosylase